MDVDTPDPMSVLNHGLTIINIVALLCVLGYQIIMALIQARSKRLDDKALGKLTSAVLDMLTMIKVRGAEEEAYREAGHSFMNDMTGTMSGVRRMMADLISRNSGAMNKDNSLRLIEQAFPNVIQDIVTIFANSLEANDYATRKDFVRTRVKTLIGQALDNLRSSLSYFQMSIDVDLFFSTDPKETSLVRYVLANQLWDLVEPLYTQQRDVKERLEEVRLMVPNTIEDYLNAVKTKIESDSRG